MSSPSPLVAGRENTGLSITLANERTFLAWIRTALALMAGAVGIEQFSPQPSSANLRLSLSLLLLSVAAAMGIMAWRRWRRNEYAMRLENNLPYTRALFILAGFMMVQPLSPLWKNLFFNFNLLLQWRHKMKMQKLAVFRDVRPRGCPPRREDPRSYQDTHV